MAKRIRTRRRHRAVAIRFFAVAGLVALAAAAAGVVFSQHRLAITPVDAEAPAAPAAIPALARLNASVPDVPQRAVFPYSVVPGGVESVTELQKAIATDPVVADHYKGFDLSKARVERLATPRVAHVSYRVGDRVYWTRKPLVLPAGERVITDGTRVARTRCANQVANLPGVTSPAEPAPAILDTPARSRPLLAPSVFALSTTQRLPAMAPLGAPPTGGAGSSSGGNSGSAGGGGFAGGGGGRSPSAGTAADISIACTTGGPDCTTGDAGGDPPEGNPPGGNPPGGNPPGGDHPGGTPPGGTPPGGTPPGGTPPGGTPPGGNPLGGTPPGGNPPGGNPPGGDPPGGTPETPWTPPENPFVPPLTTPPGGDDPPPPRPEVPETIPEPGSVVLLLTGAGGLLVRALRTRRRG
jgi:uncharacterized membrane protein YgcG